MSILELELDKKNEIKPEEIIPHFTELFDQEFLDKYRDRQPNWGFSNLGYIVFKRTYSRQKESGQYEEWPETIERCIRGAQKIGAQYTKKEAKRLFDHIFKLKCCFPGRGLWQLGTKTVDEIGADSLVNCWVSKVSTIEDFVFIFAESMLGGGVGAVITKEYTQELPRVKKNVKIILKDTKDADFICPDSKEGWRDLWRKVLEAYLVTGKSFSYSTVCIRSSGEPIKRFGGVAPGPKPLKDGVTELCKILDRRIGKKLRTQDVADIICCGGQVVKSGGVRRTALILQGDVDDASFMNLKRWDLDNIPHYRANSNNSLITNKIEHISEKFWEGYNGNGEPCGLINIKNCRKYGRIHEEEFDGFSLNNEGIVGVNPCGKSPNEDKECCNLAELFLNNITSKEEMLDCAVLLYKTQKAVAACKYLHEETNDVVHKNMRLGLGITGVCQKIENLEEWSDYTYRNLRKFDKEYSKLNSWPESIRLTTVKPSGTLSLLAGSTPGGHPGFSKYHMRTVRFASNDTLLPKLKRAGYKIEPEIRLDNTENHEIQVVYFPCVFDDKTIVAKDYSAIDQLNLLKILQTKWADQAVSITVYYKKEELDDIKSWLSSNYNSSIKSVSFLLHSEHGFRQSPLQEITEEDYRKEIRKIQPMELDHQTNGSEVSFDECVGGACPIK